MKKNPVAVVATVVVALAAAAFGIATASAATAGPITGLGGRCADVASASSDAGAETHHPARDVAAEDEAAHRVEATRDHERAVRRLGLADPRGLPELIRFG